MSDEKLRELERAYLAQPSTDALRALREARFQAGLRLPYPVIRALPRWKRLLQLVDGFYAEPLRPQDGCSEEELAKLEARLGSRLPDAVAEWFLLLGRRLRRPFDDSESIYRLVQVVDEYTPPGLLDLYANDCGGWGLAVALDAAGEDPPTIDYAISQPEQQGTLGPVSECLLNIVAKQTAWSFGGGQSLLGALAPSVVGGHLRNPSEEVVAELRRLEKTDHEGPDGRSPGDLPEVRSDFSTFVSLVEPRYGPAPLWVQYAARGPDVEQLGIVSGGAGPPLISARIAPGGLVGTLTGMERAHFLELVDLTGPEVQERIAEMAGMLRRPVPQTVEDRQRWGGSTQPAEAVLREHLGGGASIRVEHSRTGEDLLFVIQSFEPSDALRALRAVARTGSLRTATVSPDLGRFRLVAYDPPPPTPFLLPDSLEHLLNKK